MNLILARACTNSCPYCFAAEERNGSKKNLLPIANAIRVAEWAHGSGLETLSLLGGEPFIHPELGNIVKIFRKVSPKTNLRILTGGIFKKQLIDIISPDEVSLVFNVNEPRDYHNPKHFNKVLNNIEIAISKGFHVVLGFNVWRLDFDPDFIPKLASKYARSSFCWTVANPVRGTNSLVVKPVVYSALADRCFEMLQKASRFNLDALLDCPIPYCFFSDAQLGWITQYHSGTVAGMGTCSPIMDITPELEVLRCFALSDSPRLQLTDFNSSLEIQAWFVRNIDAHLLRAGVFEKCSDCPHFFNRRCYGGCLAGHPENNDPNDRLNTVQMVKSTTEALEANNPELVLELYSKSGIWENTDQLTFNAALAAAQVGRWREAFEYATRANELSGDWQLKQKVREFLVRIPMRHALIPLEQPKGFASEFVHCRGANVSTHSTSNGSKV